MKIIFQLVSMAIFSLILAGCTSCSNNSGAPRPPSPAPPTGTVEPIVIESVHEGAVIMDNDLTPTDTYPQFQVSGSCSIEDSEILISLDKDFESVICGDNECEQTCDDQGCSFPLAQFKTTCSEGTFSRLLPLTELAEKNFIVGYRGPVEIKAEYTQNPSLFSKVNVIDLAGSSYYADPGIFYGPGANQPDSDLSVDGYDSFPIAGPADVGLNLVVSRSLYNPRNYNEEIGDYDLFGVDVAGKPLAGESKLSLNDSCDGGEWKSSLNVNENWEQEYQTINVLAQEEPQFISFEYRMDGIETACFVREIKYFPYTDCSGNHPKSTPGDVCNANELKQLVDANPYGTFVLASDLDLTDKNVSINTLFGTIDGAGFKIKNGTGNNRGLVVNNFGIIKNLKVEDVDFNTSTSSAGVLVSTNEGLVKDIELKNVKITFSGTNFAGGLVVGYNNGIIQNVTAENITVIGNSSFNSIGGIAGVSMKNSEINGVFLKNVTVKYGTNVGGITGYTEAAQINNVSIDGGWLEGSEEVGGVVGYAGFGFEYPITYRSLIKDASVTGLTIQARSSTGGIVGMLLESDIQNGNVSSSQILAQYQSGMIPDQTGGICGFASGSSTVSTVEVSGSTIQGLLNLGEVVGKGSAPTNVTTSNNTVITLSTE